MEFVLTTRDGVSLSGEEAGEGYPVVLLHGLTATRRYVVHGSRALERSGHRVISYDARAHGRSSAAPAPDRYAYGDLTDDLEAVLDDRGVERALVAGVSMGAHTLLSFALRRPERAAGLVIITPAYSGDSALERTRLERWDRLAAGLRDGGIDGFLEAYEIPSDMTEAMAATVRTVIRQRLTLQDHPDALADALQAVPRSAPFNTIADLAELTMPVTVVGSNDEHDPEHPLAVARAYAETIPGAELITDAPGKSPVAWQGSQISKVIAETAARV
jgi:pimeloyl-ACP methyl ester carboxylesterase